MDVDLFAGVPVRDYERSKAWYERLLGSVAFIPNDAEAVWELAPHRYLYIDVRPDDAGHALQTVFLGDLDAWVDGAAERGVTPDSRETYENGVRKITYRDPDGNEIGFGGAASDP